MAGPWLGWITQGWRRIGLSDGCPPGDESSHSTGVRVRRGGPLSSQSPERPASPRGSWAAATASLPFLKYKVAKRRRLVPSTIHRSLQPVNVSDSAALRGKTMTKPPGVAAIPAYSGGSVSAQCVDCGGSTSLSVRAEDDIAVLALNTTAMTRSVTFM